jgi:hypothetical protein
MFKPGHRNRYTGMSHYNPIYMSIESLKRRMPWLFKTPSTPLGGRGKGSVIGLALGESDDLSVTNASP